MPHSSSINLWLLHVTSDGDVLFGALLPSEISCRASYPLHPWDTRRSTFKASDTSHKRGMFRRERDDPINHFPFRLGAKTGGWRINRVCHALLFLAQFSCYDTVIRAMYTIASRLENDFDVGHVG